MLDFSHLHVLVVGDVMLDRYLYGSVERVSPEAPVPVFSRGRETSMPGGAGNVARNITALGAQATLVGLVGAGSTELRAGIAAAGITDALVESTTRPTTTKLRVVAGNQQMMRIDDEATQALSDAETAGLLAALDAALAQGPDAIIVSDYGKGVLAPAVLTRLRGAPIFVDPKGVDFARYRGAACITPNAAEMALAAGLPTRTEAECTAAARHVMARDGVAAILVTRSARGMLLVRPETALSVPARAQEVFDVSGAGDTVIAALALAHALGRGEAGAGLEDAMRLANVAAGIVVAKLGTATTSAAELSAALAGGQQASALLDLAATRALIAQWKAAGLSVGFANGCFDILHAGHVALLAQAAAACDRLVVALNSDASVTRLKGPARPVNALEDRAGVIAALRHVSAVTAFEQDTPLETIQALLPDVLVKGADYTAETVVGWPEVRANGGRLLLAQLLPGRSTTRILAGKA